MPTPVAAARQCLTPEATAALDEAVAVALRRGHGQTTSLHMISALLSLPGSSLREACARARRGGASACPARVQFKALELSLTVSLDRLPSNSQNRAEGGPPVSNSLMAAIKRSQANQRRQPENYTLYQQQKPACSSSIPVVKVELQNLVISILDDPLVSRVFGEAGFRNFDIKMALLRKGTAAGGGFYPSQVFGCTSRYKRPNPPLFLCNFPFLGCFPGDEENLRRICEVMRTEKNRCPLLVGVSAGDTLKVFLEKISKGLSFLDGFFAGMRVVCVKDEIFRCLNGDFDDGPLRLKLEEVEKMVGDCKVVVNFGDLNELDVGSDCNNNFDGVRLLVERLSKLVKVCGEKLWLTGAAANYEVYYKVLKRFPTIGDDWDLEILPITSFKFDVGGSNPRSSLMESFVPLGGFFSMPSEAKNSSSNTCENLARCHLCNEKYEQEVARLSNEVPRASVAEQYNQPCFGSPSSRGKYDDSLLLNAKITSFGKKWDDICRKHHFSQTFLKGFQIFDSKKENEIKNGSTNSTGSAKDQINKNPSSSSSKKITSFDMYPKPDKSLDILRKSSEVPSEPKRISDSSNAGTNLCLGIISHPPLSYHDSKDPKSIYKMLVDGISQQEDVISAIVKTITGPRKAAGPQNLWIYIRGPDRLGKKKLGVALAEILYGSRECLVYADLSFQKGSTRVETIFHKQLTNKYELKMRGTVIDFLVEKLSRNPSVVFLEYIDEADLVVQNSLLQAVKKGRLTDLRGKEVNISNCIFLGSSSHTAAPNENKSNKYAEEDILNAKGGSIKMMMIGFDLNDDPTNQNSFFSNKRKLPEENVIAGYRERACKASKSSLDLNLPAEGDILSQNSENATAWVEEEFDQTVVFGRVDFDLLAERVCEEINSCLRSAVGLECSVEIENDVMRQILAGGYLYGNERVGVWVQNVVRRAFSEVGEKFGVSARSVIKIVGCEGTACDDELLPNRILVG